MDVDIPDTFAEPIRVWHLMTHTAGFEERALGMSTLDPAAIPPLANYLADKMPVRVRPPGEYPGYSNYATTLAAYVVERASEMPWDEYVAQNILSPLGMTTTNPHIVASDKHMENHAAGYRYRAGRYERGEFAYMSDAPAGVVSATAGDMARFMLAHLNEGEFDGVRIMQAATAQRMQSSRFNLHDDLRPILHGFYRSDRNDQVVFGHDGDIDEFHSTMKLLPEHELGVFVAVNSQSAGAVRTGLVNAFVDYFFPAEYLRMAPEAADVALMDYAGEYIPLRSNQSRIERLGILVNNLTVSAAADELLVKRGNRTIRWIPVEKDRFVERYEDRSMVFVRDDVDAVTHIVVNSSLFGTFRRVSGIDAPGNIRNLLLSMFGIALIAALGYGSRAVSRASPERRLPRIDVAVAWTFALLIVVLYVHLGLVLGGDLDRFRFGMPAEMNANLVLMNVNAILGTAVIIFAMRQWVSGRGGVAARVRYSVVAVAAAISLWMAYYFKHADLFVRLATDPFGAIQPAIPRYSRYTLASPCDCDDYRGPQLTIQEASSYATPGYCYLLRSLLCLDGRARECR